MNLIYLYLLSGLSRNCIRSQRATKRELIKKGQKLEKVTKHGVKYLSRASRTPVAYITTDTGAKVNIVILRNEGLPTYLPKL